MRQAIVLFPSKYSHSTVDIKGHILFTQLTEMGPVIVDVHLRGLTPGKHGFHVHEKGLPLGSKQFDCKVLGGHFNPHGVTHGSYRLKTIRHVGDLINNLNVGRDGNVSVSFLDHLISLYPGQTCIIERSIVIHEEPDDEGIPGMFSKTKTLSKNQLESLKTGNAGKRIACGNIKLFK